MLKPFLFVMIALVLADFALNHGDVTTGVMHSFVAMTSSFSDAVSDSILTR